MSKRITKAEIQAYVKSGGVHCPYCKSQDIESYGTWKTDDVWAVRSVKCNHCHKTWDDFYTLKGIVED